MLEDFGLLKPGARDWIQIDLAWFSHGGCGAKYLNLQSYGSDIEEPRRRFARARRDCFNLLSDCAVCESFCDCQDKMSGKEDKDKARPNTHR